MRRSIVFILVAACAAVLPAPAASASCVGPPDPDVVFEGRSAGQVDTKFEGPEGSTPFAFDVSEVVEGEIGDRVVVWASVAVDTISADGTAMTGSSSVDVERPIEGQRYRVSAVRSEDQGSLNALVVNACTGGIEEATGAPPRESNPGNAGLLAPLVGAGGILLLLVVAALAQKDRPAQTVT